MELLTVDSVEHAVKRLLACFEQKSLACELVTLSEAPGRILYEDVRAAEDIPAFRRSTVDGYAVVSKDTAAAGESMPVFLKVKEQVEMGKPAGSPIKSGECAEVPTGGMVPEGADAVVMVEYTEAFGADGIAVYQSTASGRGVVQKGEDMKSGSLLLPRGRKLLPQDVGALAAAGVRAVPVYVPLKLGIISTGDELVGADMIPSIGQVRDINTCALRALAQKNGFEVVNTAVLEDDEDRLEQKLTSWAPACDMIAVSGGSSQGKKDVTKKIIDRVTEGGVFTHGLAMKPGKPTILGFGKKTKTLFIGLPGHPVSAMMVFELLLCRMVRELTGQPESPALPARLSCNVASSPGKLTCWPAMLEFDESGYMAAPVFGKSGLITTMTRADGYFTVERDREGLTAGDSVMVHLF